MTRSGNACDSDGRTRTTPRSLHRDFADKMELEQKLRAETAVILHDLAACIESMATAMDEDDGILGVLAGQGIANHLSALPGHVREVFLEYASDEAHAGYLADRRYMAAMEESEQATLVKAVEG